MSAVSDDAEALVLATHLVDVQEQKIAALKSQVVALDAELAARDRQIKELQRNCREWATKYDFQIRQRRKTRRSGKF
jgi:predicted RNase H-like nuclease (RuvC/YqgF family)